MASLKESYVVPLYIQLADRIKDSIVKGELTYGEQIMSEAQLSQHYGVSRITVRKAISLLVDENILIKRQGKGTFVAFPQFAEALSPSNGSFTLSCLNSNLIPATKVLSKAVIPSTPSLERKLELSGPCDLVQITRIRYVNDCPAIYEEDYFTMNYRFLLDIDLNDRSVFDLIRDKLGIIPKHYIDLFQIKLATPDQARYLQVEHNFPLLEISQTIFTEDNSVVYFNRQTVRTDIYKYTIRSI